MKCKIEVEIEVPDNLKVTDEENKPVSKEEQKQFIKDYFISLKSIVFNIPDDIDNNEYDYILDEYYNLDGDLPRMTFKVKEKSNKKIKNG